MIEFLAKHETKVIAHQPHSPDLAPCQIINRWNACIGSKGAYFEGNNKDFIKIHKTLFF